jgi:hypothetical protein
LSTGSASLNPEITRFGDFEGEPYVSSLEKSTTWIGSYAFIFGRRKNTGVLFKDAGFSNSQGCGIRAIIIGWDVNFMYTKIKIIALITVKPKYSEIKGFAGPGRF